MRASSSRCARVAARTGCGMRLAPALLKCSTFAQPGVSARARRRSKVTCIVTPPLRSRLCSVSSKLLRWHVFLEPLDDALEQIARVLRIVEPVAFAGVDYELR